MEDGKIRIVWNGKGSKVLGCVDTTIPNVLTVLGSMGRHPNEFNGWIVDAKAKPHLPVPCILWMRGPEVGPVLANLKDKGLCKEVLIAK